MCLCFIVRNPDQYHDVKGVPFTVHSTHSRPIQLSMFKFFGPKRLMCAWLPTSSGQAGRLSTSSEVPAGKRGNSLSPSCRSHLAHMEHTTTHRPCESRRRQHSSRARMGGAHCRTHSRADRRQYLAAVSSNPRRHCKSRGRVCESVYWHTRRRVIPDPGD